MIINIFLQKWMKVKNAVAFASICTEEKVMINNSKFHFLFDLILLCNVYRYNISTNDYDAWSGISSKQNAQPNPQPGKPTRVDISKDYGFTDPEGAVESGYIYKNDPVVKIFPGVDFSLQLALNTAQFGRTFQDRYYLLTLHVNPSNAEATFIQRTRVQRFLKTI